jgi:hypothetical protein
MKGLVRRARELTAAASKVDSIQRQQRQIQRELVCLSQRLGTAPVELKVDAVTPRLPLLRKTRPGTPLIRRTGDGWMSGAVFDGRPISFAGRRLVYFCGQPFYRSDGLAFIGVAEWRGDSLEVHPKPVLVPDREQRGIDIPGFAVWHDRIVGVYLDDYGHERTGLGWDAGLFVATSSDGRVFTKQRVELPFRGDAWDRIGLPWLLGDGGRLWIYWRGKKAGAASLVRTPLDLASASVGPAESASPLARNPINVAVARRGPLYLLFHGASLGGGLYVTPSRDGKTWMFDKEVMLVGDDDFEWGWDMYKVCASPDNGDGPEVEVCYLGSSAGEVSIGHGVFDARQLAHHWGLPW